MLYSFHLASEDFSRHTDSIVYSARGGVQHWGLHIHSRHVVYGRSFISNVRDRTDMCMKTVGATNIRACRISGNPPRFTRPYRLSGKLPFSQKDAGRTVTFDGVVWVTINPEGTYLTSRRLATQHHTVQSNYTQVPLGLTSSWCGRSLTTAALF